MDNKKINIAVIVSGIDEEYQNTILKGIHEFAKGKNINLLHFVAFGGILKSTIYDAGEFNIYKLVNYNKIDGVILLTNTISSDEQTEEIISAVRNAGIPAVSVDNDFGDMYYIGIDNFKAMKEMIEHFLDCHHCTKIDYITGPRENPESALRLKAYKTVLEEHGIPVEENRIFWGSFRGEDGREAIRKLLASGEELPDVIICANDAMALSATVELQKNDISVPEDIMIAGFDNIYAAKHYSPSITSVERPLKISGYKACEKIYSHINGIKTERVEILDTKCIFGESCGCNFDNLNGIPEYKRSNYRTIESINIDVPMINRMFCDFEESVSIRDNINILKKFVCELKIEKFFLCMCSDWNSGYAFTRKTDKSVTSAKYITQGYTDRMDVMLAYVDGKFMEYDSFNSNEMLPDIFKPSDKSDMYYFMPIHFRDRCLGYCVMCNTNFPMVSKVFHTWVMSISNAFENVRKIMCLDQMVDELDRLYIIDPLGQIYNRHGFSKNAEPLYKKCAEELGCVMIMFIDMDGLKYVNDNFGHNEGDFALCRMSDAIKSVCRTDREVCARFGGDEFIIFASGYKEEDAVRMSRRITDYLDECNKKYNKPYTIAASIGYHITSASVNKPLYKLISIADQKMYEQKKLHKGKQNIR